MPPAPLTVLQQPQPCRPAQQRQRDVPAARQGRLQHPHLQGRGRSTPAGRSCGWVEGEGGGGSAGAAAWKGGSGSTVMCQEQWPVWIWTLPLAAPAGVSDSSISHRQTGYASITHARKQQRAIGQPSMPSPSQAYAPTPNTHTMHACGTAAARRRPVLLRSPAPTTAAAEAAGVSRSLGRRPLLARGAPPGPSGPAPSPGPAPRRAAASSACRVGWGGWGGRPHGGAGFPHPCDDGLASTTPCKWQR